MDWSHTRWFYIRNEFSLLLQVATMAARNEVSLQIRKLIVEDRKIGLSLRKIAEKYKISKTGVEKICNKFTESHTIGNLPGRGRKRATTTREDALIVRQTKVKSNVSSTEIKDQLNLNVSTSTIRRRLHETGLTSRVSIKKPMITLKNKKKRLEFAKKHIDKPLSFWKTVVWSDESKFELVGKKKRRKVWRKVGEALLDKHTTKTVKFGGGSIMVWGCFSWSGVGNLHKIDGIMDARRYIDILRNNLTQSVEKMDIDDQYIFQQDNDPKHTAGVTKRFFERNAINVLEWPPQSADLNPIENLWACLDSKVPPSGRTSRDIFFTSLQAAWDGLAPDFLQKLVESMNQRLYAVIKARGGNTKY